ncbi:MAG: hypothetical protein EWM72_00596 [Nitrospira sp.]|nr:MAG: hypothetical protein EWM72_00596 [Nitrospira sp.]
MARYHRLSLMEREDEARERGHSPFPRRPLMATDRRDKFRTSFFQLIKESL